MDKLRSWPVQTIPELHMSHAALLFRRWQGVRC